MRAKSQSNAPRNTPITAASAMTSTVNREASWRVGHVTFRSSEKTSPKNPKIEKRLDGVMLRSGLTRFWAILFPQSTDFSAAVRGTVWERGTGDSTFEV